MACSHHAVMIGSIGFFMVHLTMINLFKSNSRLAAAGIGSTLTLIDIDDRKMFIRLATGQQRTVANLIKALRSQITTLGS